jgi:hypothetical protein
MDILCALWNAKKRGRRTLSLEGWAGEIGKPSADVSLYLYELELKEIGKIFRKNDDEITITSPRMIRDERARKWNAKRKQEQRDKHLSQECPANVSVLSHQSHRDISESESESETELREEKKKSGAPSRRLSDEEFLVKLRESPAYKHCDVDQELAKMDTWLLTKPGRQKTRRFIVQWLNKIDKPLPTNGYRPPAIRKPVIIEQPQQPSIGKDEASSILKRLGMTSVGEL